MKWVRGALLALLFLVTFVTLMQYFFHRLEKPFTRSIREQIPDEFPVLVVHHSATGEFNCKAAFYRNLASERLATGTLSYLVPIDHQEECAQQVRAFTRAREHPVSFDNSSVKPWDAWFKVKRISATRQALEVFCTGDDDYMNRSWYEATDDTLFPIKHQHYFGPPLASEAGIASFLLSVLTCCAGVIGYRFLKKRWNPV